jgi:3-hydroxyacyl-CoA dehydrogenase
METPSIKGVGVIGTGVIGCSWTSLFLSKGLRVIVSDPDPATPAKLDAFLTRVWPTLTKIGLRPDASPDNYKFVTNIDDYLGEIDFIQEVKENVQNWITDR